MYVYNFAFPHKERGGGENTLEQFYFKFVVSWLVKFVLGQLLMVDLIVERGYKQLNTSIVHQNICAKLIVTLPL